MMHSQQEVFMIIALILIGLMDFMCCTKRTCV